MPTYRLCLDASRTLFGSALLLSGMALHAADWSSTEVQLQHGDLVKPFQGGSSDAETGGSTVMTFQHASGWAYGDNFFFFDNLSYGRTDAEAESNIDNDSELYGEWYSNFSLGKISGKSMAAGPIRDLGFILGFNFAAEVDTVYYLPGVRLALDLPGFAFANLDLMAYWQDNASEVGGGVTIDEDDAYIVDFNFAWPFTLGKSQWTIEGHIEYVDGADTDIAIPGVGTVAGERESWILAQPQIRVDVGSLLGTEPKRFFAGIEYQYWRNKLGDADTDESVVQALLVWRL